MGTVERFVASDGVGLSVHRTPPPDARASNGPPVFLLHGLASDAATSWVAPGMVDRLARAGHEVFAVDMRGHGSSDKPHDSIAYGETRMSRDLVELWDHLNVSAVDLVGHSMGGVVALITAAADGRIRRLVLSGVGAYQLDYDGMPLRHFDTAGFAEALLADEPASIDDPALAEFRREIDESGNDRLAIAAHLRVLHCDPFSFDRITATTLVLNGDDDPLSPEPDRLAAALPVARSVVLPGDHAVTKTTRAFIDQVAGFLAD